MNLRNGKRSQNIFQAPALFYLSTHSPLSCHLLCLCLTLPQKFTNYRNEKDKQSHHSRLIQASSSIKQKNNSHLSGYI